MPATGSALRVQGLGDPQSMQKAFYRCWTIILPMFREGLGLEVDAVGPRSSSNNVEA